MRKSQQADEGSCWTRWHIQERQREVLYGCTGTTVPVKIVQSQFDVGAGKVTEHHGLGLITAKREHDEANMIGYLKCWN